MKRVLASVVVLVLAVPLWSRDRAGMQALFAVVPQARELLRDLSVDNARPVLLETGQLPDRKVRIDPVPM
jgi:hypothetical protein